MENPTNKPEPSRAGSHDSSDGFSSLVALIESAVAIQKQMHMDPDATEVILSDAFFALSESERNALLDYAKSKGYAVPDAEMLAEPEPTKPEPVVTSAAHREETAQARQHDEPRDRRQELLERLEALQEGGYQLTHADVGARMDRRHNRIFVGYGVKRTRDGHVVIGEAFAKRAGDGYETPLRDSSIAIPEPVAERWENDAAFRSEIIRRAVDMRDELEGEERGGRYRGGTALIFDGIKDGQLTDELEAVQRDPSLLKPKWKYRLDNRNHYDEVAVEDISPKILEAVIADPHNYHQRPRGENSPEKQAAWQRWNTWFGKELQRKREQVISRELERIYAPHSETAPVADATTEKTPIATSPGSAVVETIQPVETIETPSLERAESAAPAAENLPGTEKSEAKEPQGWQLDEIYEIAAIRVNELGRLFENPRDVPMFVKVARDVVTAQLLEAGRRSKSPRKIASQIDVLGALSHAFGDYYIQKGEDDAGRLESQEILLNELIAEVRNEAFGETTGQESEKELKSRQDITDYLVIKYLEIDDKRGGFDFKGSDTLKRRVTLMREKLGE